MGQTPYGFRLNSANKPNDYGRTPRRIHQVTWASVIEKKRSHEQRSPENRLVANVCFGLKTAIRCAWHQRLLCGTKPTLISCRLRDYLLDAVIAMLQPKL
jgi:hypothetical protein